jgi:DNA primase small subunit
MKPATLEFLRQRFGEYYRKAILSAPPSLPQREWGFLFFDPNPKIQMRRHMAFGGKEELFDYLKTLIPAHVYYSSAYYETPAAPTMAEKHWTGADLIFDLDADHIVRGPYAMMLARVKEETEKLIAMLTGEMGIDPRSIGLVFSGGRGYHVHVRDIAFRGWGSEERRELINYVCGIGIDPSALLKNPVITRKSWKYRILSTIEEYTDYLDNLDKTEAIKKLTGISGIGKTSAERFFSQKDLLVLKIRSNPETLTQDRTYWPVLQALLSDSDGEFAKRLRAKAALADEPVTTDIKRLIRLPTSLHGGSGMRVQPVSISSLSAFDPLVDAVVFGDRDLRVESAFSLDMPMLGNPYHIEKGMNTVPEALAVFLCCRGIGEIAGGA